MYQPILENRVLDHGLLSLVEVWGHDYSPAYAARTSYRRDANEFTDEQNQKLIQYLYKHNHTTPLEFCGAVFFCVMPIFVARQWVRHRTASINEESLRYIDARNEFYVPARERMQRQSEDNKQGSSSQLVEAPEVCQELIRASCERSFRDYEVLLQEGLAKELARGVLPLNTYTSWMWACDMNNILKFLTLRCDPHAQYEIRAYADTMRDQLSLVFPTLIAAWESSR